MIHKIERLMSIGKFRNYQASGPVNFHKLNLIYGDNGSGKTTLTSVIRSLNTNNPQIVHSRISTNHTTPQAAQVIQSGTPQVFYTFGASGWTRTLSDIEIFDIHFINDNIYSGFDFGDDHKKQLHQFVIGSHGITIQQQMETNKADKATSKALQATLEQQILTAVGNNLVTGILTEFINIPISSATSINQSITDGETALTNATANAIIQTLSSLSQLVSVNSGIDFEAIKTDLQMTTDTIQNQTLNTLFSSHCQDLSSNGIISPETWLEQGFSYINSKHETDTNENGLHCPFCRQGINSGLDIIQAYSTLFNENFNALTARIQTHLSNVQSFNLAAFLQSLNAVNQSNSSAIISWSSHLPSSVEAPVYNVLPNDATLQAQYDGLLAILNQKAQNPSTAVVVNAVENFNTSLQNIATNIATYNRSVTTYNSAITIFKSDIQTISQAQTEVERLKRIQKRFEPTVNTLCTQLTAEKQNLRTLESAYTQLSAQQQATASAFFTNYGARINHYLGTVFKTLFQIQDVVHIAPQGRATHSKIGYKLTIDGKDISFEEGQPFSARECLSEGDKSTIALAFFLSKLDIDTNKADKILVFDDPLSSLDTNRRTYTVGIIKALVSQMKQVIVLSHNEYFLHEIGKDFGAALKKNLRITEDFSAKASILEVCDLDNLVKNDYFRHVEALENFRSHPDHAIKDTVLGWLRNVLEAHLRFKFYREVRSMTGQPTFGALITFLESSAALFKDNSNRTQIISDLRLINSISWRPHHGTPSPDFTTLSLDPHTMTAAELDNLIQDTLRLINDQL